MQEPFYIKKIAVLGAGVMGAQIAAHCVNAGIETDLFDLAAEGEHPNAIVDKALLHLKKLKPSPLATPDRVSLLQAKNYKENLNDLSHCDLIIEAIAERFEWKKDLYQCISSHLKKDAIVVTNTSGLSINKLADFLPEHHRKRFCGVHFFNPPRYMHLAELIPATSTSENLLDNLETWLTRYLGKGVVRAKDTPNFIANRIGVFSLLTTLHHAQEMSLGLDEVDALTGTLLGRPKSATFRTMDVVGLDTMHHVVDTMKNQLSDDPWHKAFHLPEWISKLIKQGHLGQKTGQGIYRKRGKVIEVFDLNHNEYREAKGSVDHEVKAIMKLSDPKERMLQLWRSSHPQAQFLAACYRDLFHYCAYHLAEIAETVRDVDLAIRWGFGWQHGPFESWDVAGVNTLKVLIEQAIESGHTMCDASLPAWLDKTDAFYSDKDAYAPNDESFKGRRQLSVYQRQFFPDGVLKETRRHEEVLYENSGVRLWHLKDDIAVVTFKSKANTISQTVLDGLNEALNLAENQCQGLIIYQHDLNNFSSGADLKGVADLLHAKKIKALEAMIGDFQKLAMRLKYSPIPVVAAVRGRALGGGCELMMHCDAVVAGFESYPGLVEAGVGLIPAGGGCKEMARRCATDAGNADLMAFLSPVFEQIAMAKVAGSAPDALRLGYLRPQDNWVMHSQEVLYTALEKVKFLQAQNYAPPIPELFVVAGREGHARLQAGLVNWLEGQFISQHDYFLANQLAKVLCGGEVNAGQKVDEKWILTLEKEAFMALAETEATQARIGHLLETGKPLRN